MLLDRLVFTIGGAELCRSDSHCPQIGEALTIAHPVTGDAADYRVRDVRRTYAPISSAISAAAAARIGAAFTVDAGLVYVDLVREPAIPDGL